jgi:hypothetical protein
LAALLGAAFSCRAQTAPAQPALADEFAHPPDSAKLRAYWWWLNGNVTRDSITRDLEEMKARGFGGALICDADGSSQDHNARAPHGPTFFSPEWRELFKHTLREANRLGLEMSLNIQSGWNLGGPMVKPEDAPKKLVWTETQARGGTNLAVRLETPKGRDGFYRDLFVLAYPIHPLLPAKRQPLRNQPQKALLAPLPGSSAPSSQPLFQEYPATAGEEDTAAGNVLNLTTHLGADGVLRWDAPAGPWQIIRFGFTLNDHCRVSTCSEGWDGYALDPFDAGAFNRYWDAVVEPLIADAGPLAGTTLKYLHTDSWEVEVANWTPTLREEFQNRRGYDPLPWLPVIAGKIVNSREESDRFLNDFRRTMGDLAVDHHFKIFKERAHAHGLLIHPESGGPHAVPIDAQQCLGLDDAPMSEFWAWSWQHRIGDSARYFVKQPASAAHTYGRKLVLAEGFTTIGPHWQETLWDNLKPSFDKAICEGLNRLVWHAFVCSPGSEGIPGQQYFAGTHLNPNVTWWNKSAPFFDYLNRCQAMMQRGQFVADVLYYYGDHVPNFTQHKRTDPAAILPGFDYDVITAEALLERASVRDGRIVLPDGMSYRLLVLPERDQMSLPVLQKIGELTTQGATVVGPKPVRAETLRGYPGCDADVKNLADQLWTSASPGRVISGKSAREVLLVDGVKPDFAVVPEHSGDVDYIHRRDANTDIYFVANRTNVALDVRCAFRVIGKAPELWDAVSGSRRFCNAYAETNGQTFVPLKLPPFGSAFVIFAEPASRHVAAEPGNERSPHTVQTLTNSWRVDFDPRWGGPTNVAFDTLQSWTERAEPGIKYYSGTATYRTSFVLPDFNAGEKTRFLLDLGDVRELAEVRVNGKSCGVVWSPPFRADISGALRAGTNALEVEVVNFWPNRIIGDASQTNQTPFTRTNIRGLTTKTPLIRSGLFGPVTLLRD